MRNTQDTRVCSKDTEAKGDYWPPRINVSELSSEVQMFGPYTRDALEKGCLCPEPWPRHGNHLWAEPICSHTSNNCNLRTVESRQLQVKGHCAKQNKNMP